MRNNHPKSENKALKERAAKTKGVEARLKNMTRERLRPRKKLVGDARPKKSGR